MERVISCTTCIGVCCRQGVRMHLSADEAAFMRDGGTGLTPVDPAANPTDGVTEFRLTTNCGYLEETEDVRFVCTAYEDPGRPAVCGDFAVGSLGCRVMRVGEGIDTAAEFAAYQPAIR